MPKIHPVSFRASSQITVLREDFIAICEGDDCAAMILSQMMYWHEIKVAARDQAERENAKLLRMGKRPTQSTDLWVYKSQSEMRTEILAKHGDRAIIAAFGFLTDREYLLQRGNAEEKRDRTRQYLFNIPAVQGAIDLLPALGYDDPDPTNTDNSSDSSLRFEGDLTDSNLQNCRLQTAKMQFASCDNAVSMRGRDIYQETTTKSLGSSTNQAAKLTAGYGGDSDSSYSEQTPEQTPSPKHSDPKTLDQAAGTGCPRAVSQAAWRPDDFNALLAAFPKSDDRKAAIKSWDRIRPGDELAAMLLDAATRFTAYHKREGTNKRFISSLAVWLNGEKWENDNCKAPAAPLAANKIPAARLALSGPVVTRESLRAECAQIRANLAQRQALADAKRNRFARVS